MQDNLTGWRRVAVDLMLLVALYAALEGFAVWRLTARLVPGALTPLHAYASLWVAERAMVEKAAAKATAKKAPPADAQGASAAGEATK